jgi:uncharacterized membrane protein
MASSKLIRWSGLASLMAGALWVVGGIMLLVISQRSPFASFSDYLIEVLTLLGLLGTLAGIAGLHVLQRERYGRFGTAGSLIAFVGFALLLVASVMFLSAGGGVPIGSTIVSIGFVTTLVGVALLGVVMLWEEVLPSWYGALFIVGNLVGVALYLQGGEILLGVVWGVTGYTLLSKRGTAEQRPSRVS